MDGELEAVIAATSQPPLVLQVSEASTLVTIRVGFPLILRNDQMAEMFYDWMAKIPPYQRDEVLTHLLQAYVE